jgi:hypothetical protein
MYPRHQRFFYLSSSPSSLTILIPRIPYINHTPSSSVHNPRPPWLDEPPSPRMNPDLSPAPPSQPSHRRIFRRCRAVLRSIPLRSSILFGAIIFGSLVFYTTFLSPRGLLLRKPQDWHGLSQHEFLNPDLEYTSPLSTPTTPAEIPLPPPPPPPPISNVLTVEQIRDIVASTRGFFTRDYSLGLGWNNVSERAARLI